MLWYRKRLCACILMLIIAHADAGRAGFYDSDTIPARVLANTSSLSPYEQSQICRSLNGSPMNNCSQADGVSYAQCLKFTADGAGWHFVDWKDFINAFSTFLL